MEKYTIQTGTIFKTWSCGNIIQSPFHNDSVIGCNYLTIHPILIQIVVLKFPSYSNPINIIPVGEICNSKNYHCQLPFHNGSVIGQDF